MTSPPSASVADDLRLAMSGDKDALDRLWSRAHPLLTPKIAGLRSAGRAGSMLQATAVAHSVYRLQAERREKRGAAFKRSDLAYAFGAEKIDWERFAAGAVEVAAETVDRIFSRIVRSEARTYLADKRRRQRRLQALDTAPEVSKSDDRHVMLSEFIDFAEQLEARDVAVLEAVELDIVYQMDPDDIALQLGVDVEHATELARRGRVLLEAWMRGLGRG